MSVIRGIERLIRSFLWFSTLFLMFLTLSRTEAVIANPEGGVVAAGTAVINSSGSTTTVNQTSDKAIINWNTFNIASGETTQFIQPSAQAIALNRIDANQGASSILGNLTANGQIWLVNPAGILFGKNATVDVAGLLATTANITDANFFSHNYQFVQSGNGSIINHGTIRIVDGGIAALVAPGVTNSGVIQANLGKVVLASGSDYTLDFYGDNLINFILPATVGNGITNTGKIIANGGAVLMTAKVAQSVIDNVINTSGYVQANSVRQHNGTIILSGGSNGTVQVSGKLIARGKHTGETGGTIKVLGDKVAVTDKAEINASGDSGRGTVLIGGDAHGAGPDQNASYTYIGPNTQINVSALQNGNGGNAIVWSNLGTQFYGNINAQGGSQSGNGGWVEVSGSHLSFNGMVNTRAPNGEWGHLLLDPKFIVVATGGGATLSTVSTFGNDAAGTDTIDPSTLNSALSNITLQANTDVIFNNSVNIAASGIGLTVQAGRSILVNAGISTNNGAISMTANSNAGTSANRQTTSSGNPTGDTETTLGNIIVASGATVNSGSAALSLTIGSTATTPYSPGSITINGGLSTSGNITLTSRTSITEGSSASIHGALLTTSSVTGTTLNTPGANNTVTIFNALNTTSGDISLTNTTPMLTITRINPTVGTGGPGSVSVTNTGNITTTGAVRASSTGSGTVTLNAQQNPNDAANTGNLTIGAAVSSGTGLVTLAAAQDLSITAGASAAYGGSGGSNAFFLTAGRDVLVRGGATIQAVMGGASSGGISISAGRDMIVREAGTNFISFIKPMTVTAARDLTIDGNSVTSLQSTAGLTINAGGNMTLGDTSTGGTGFITNGNSGAINVTVGGALTLYNGSRFQQTGALAASQTMNVTVNGGDMKLLGNSFFLDAAAAITTNVTAGNLIITGSGSGGSIAANKGVTINVSGNMALGDTGTGKGILSNGQSAALNVTVGGALTLYNGSQFRQAGSGNLPTQTINVTVNGGDMKLLGGSFFLDAVAPITTTVAAGNLLINGNGSIAANFGVNTTVSGNITLGDSTGAGRISNGVSNGITTTAGGTINLSNGSSLVNVNGSTGAINTTAAGNISFAGGSYMSNLLGNIGLTSTTGSISQTDSTGSLSTPGVLTTRSVTGTMLNGANTVSSFNGTNTGSGNISLTDTAPSFVVDAINQSGSGNVSIVTTGTLTTQGVISTQGAAVTLTASNVAFSNLTVTGGSVSVNAQQATGQIHAPGLTLNVNSANLTGKISTPIKLGGSITRGNLFFNNIDVYFNPLVSGVPLSSTVQGQLVSPLNPPKTNGITQITPTTKLVCASAQGCSDTLITNLFDVH